MRNPHKNKKGFDRLSAALNHSFEGLKATFKNEEAFRQEIFLALILIPVAFYNGDTTVEKILLDNDPVTRIKFLKHSESYRQMAGAKIY